MGKKHIRITESELVGMINESIAWFVGNEKGMPKVVAHQIDAYCKGRKAYEDSIQKGTQGKKFVEFQKEYDKYRSGGSVSPGFMEKLFSCYKNAIDSMNGVSNRDAKKYAGYKDIEVKLKSRGLDVDEIYKNWLSENGGL